MQKLRLTKREEADREEILFYTLSVHLGLTAPGWSLALKAAKIGLLKKNDVFFLWKEPLILLFMLS